MAAGGAVFRALTALNAIVASHVHCARNIPSRASSVRPLCRTSSAPKDAWKRLRCSALFVSTAYRHTGTNDHGYRYGRSLLATAAYEHKLGGRLDGVVELSLLGEAQAPGAPSGDWKDTVVGAVCAFRRALVAHPNVLPHMVAHPPNSPEAAAMYIEGPLKFLVAQGLGDRPASQLFEAVFALSFGHALLTTNYPAIEAEGMPSVEFTEASFEKSVRVLIDGYDSSSPAT